MAPRKTKEVEVEVVLEDNVVEELTVNPITDKSDKIDEIMETKLADLEGIGNVRLKRLYSNYVYTIDDLLSCGEAELASTLDISFDDASKMTRVANDAANAGGVAKNMIIKGKDFDIYRKKYIKYLTTGHDELDEILGNRQEKKMGYESGVITEYFGAFGSGKTQIMEVACAMAQLPIEPCCLHCGQTESLDGEFCTIKPEGEKNECGGKIWGGGGLTEFGKPSRVVYIDTENSFRTDRLFGIVCNRQLIKTKPLTKNQEKQDLDREPLNEEEWDKAMQFVYNMDILKPKTTALQIMYIRNLSSTIKGDFCKVCQEREINSDGTPTHQDHKLVKKDMIVKSHNFDKDIPANLIICDSLTGLPRKEFNGRGQLSDRQMKIKMIIKHLDKIVASRNVICLITNQVQAALGVMGDNIRPVGGEELAHTSTHRIYLMKPQSLKKNKITAILVDSPNNAKNEIIFELGSRGIQKLEV